MEMSTAAVVISVIALGLNGLLLASYLDLKSRVRHIDVSLDETIPKVIKGLKSDYVNKNDFNETISNIKVDERGIVSKIADLEEKMYKQEDTHSIDEESFKNIMEKSKKSVDGIGKHYYGNGPEKKEEQSSGRLKKYRVTFEIMYMYGGTIPIMYHPQYEVECLSGDMDSVVEFAQNAFDSHPNNVELEREIVKIEVV